MHTTFATLTLLAATTASAFAQEPEPTKEVRPLPPVDDVKTHWIAPAKPIVAPSVLDTPALGLGGDATKATAVEPSGPRLSYELDRVHVDEPGDGRVWAMGRNYKASFGADGATYVPFFGSAAPRNFPISFVLGSATLGGEALRLSTPRVSREDGAIALDHGALVERWHLDLVQLEQTFVLASLPWTGDLVLRLDVESELVLSDAADGLLFSGEHGRVHYGDITVIDGAGRTLTTPSVLEGDGIALRVPAAFLAEATLPITIDPVVANFFLDAARSAHTADIAYDDSTNRWMVSYQEDYSASDQDVRTEMLDANGNLIANQGVYADFTTQAWTAPRCANNNLADQFLIVAARGATGSRSIWGRTRQASSTSMAAQFEISTSFTGEKHSPDVGGDPVTVGPTYYCVVWCRVYSSTDTDIHYQLVRPDSTLLSSSTQYVDNTGATEDFTPEISKSNGIAPYATQRWNVTFNRIYTATDRDVRGAQIDWDGTLVTPSFSVDFSGEDHLYPVPSSPLDAPHGERDWACVYQADVGSHWNVRMSSLRGPDRYDVFDLTSREATMIGTGWVGQDQYGPQITSDGTQYLVTYHELYSTSTTDHDVYCTTLRHEGAGAVLVAAHENLAFSSASERWAISASRRDSNGAPGRFGIAWHQGGGATGEWDIEGVLFDIDSTWASVGTTVCLGASNSTGEPATLRAAGSAVRAQNRLRFDVHGLPYSSFGFFTMGQNPGSVSVGQGTFCIGTPFQRLSNLAQSSGSSGTIAMPLDLGGVPGNVSAGSTWRFQYWYRDSVGGTATSNLTNALSIGFL
jgi:hypothetical protein